MTYSTLSPTSFGLIDAGLHPHGQAHAVWRHELEGTRREQRRDRRSTHLHRLRLRLVG